MNEGLNDGGGVSRRQLLARGAIGAGTLTIREVDALLRVGQR